MGEQAGTAVLSVGLALIGFLLIVAALRGTYRDVWTALKAPPPNTSSSGGAGVHPTAH